MDSSGRPPAPLDPRVVVRAQLGDLRALDELLAALQEPLYLHALGIVQDGDVAADVLQDSLLIVARRLATVRDPRWCRAWAYRITTREATRANRRRSRHSWVDIATVEHVATGPEEPRFEPELVARLHELLPDVPPASGGVLRLHYVDGLTLVEIAEALELSLGTVKSRLAYGLAWLRKALPRSPA